MPTPAATKFLLGYSIALLASLYWINQPKNIDPVKTPTATALPLVNIQDLSTSITEALLSLNLGLEDIEHSESLLFRAKEGYVPIDHISLYLPQDLPVSTVVARLFAIQYPGLVLRRFEDQSLKTHVESWVNGQPTHLITITPSFDAHGPDAYGRPYPIALVIQGLGDSFQRLAPLLKLRQKYTLAINPFSAYALQWGDEGSAAGKEIWVDLAAPPAPDMDIRARLEAIPNAVGALVPKQIKEEKRLFALLKVSRWSALLGGSRLLQQSQNNGIRSDKPWPLGVTGHAWAERELARLMALAVRDGCAIGLIDGPSTSLESLGFWIHGVERQGFQLIGAKQAIAILEELKAEELKEPEQ